MKIKLNVLQWLILILIAISVLFTMSACGGKETTSNGGGATSEEGEETKRKMPIKLVENPWSASTLNVMVAKIILEEEMDYSVEVISLDESAQWAALATGDAHASLEVWPSGHADNVATYIDEQGVVENGGLLGPVGKIGWYIPTYMVKDNPALATYEGFADPANAALFATAETGDKGQFLAGAPGWVQYDADIIKNLGLNLDVVEAGSEEAVLAAVQAAYARLDPVLFYFWTPHSIHAKFDLTEVQLPPYSDECYAKIDSGGVDCDYPPDELFKIFWSGLAEAEPDAYQLLKNMNYSTENQIDLIAAVELDKKTPEEAAREWIENNETIWKAWLP